jgi:hypothetical protein
MQSRFGFVGFVFAVVAGCAGASTPTDVAPSTTASAPVIAVSPQSAPSASDATPPVPVVVADPNVCPLGKSDTWKTCVGKIVEIRGQNPKMVYQHPMIAPMSPPGSGAPTIHQGYLETSEGNQIIVLSRQQDKCSGTKRVKGSLRDIDLGGPDKTKESYRGWAIYDATIECE